MAKKIIKIYPKSRRYKAKTRRQGFKKKVNKVKCPGGKIRSKGLGRGLGTGRGRGPIGGLGRGGGRGVRRMRRR